MGHLILKILNIPTDPPRDTSVNQHNTQLQSNVLSMGHVTPGLFLTTDGMTAVNLQGKEICAYILSHQSLRHTILCYSSVVCMLSYLAYLDNAQQSVFPPSALYSCKQGEKYCWDKDSLCSFWFHCFVESFAVYRGRGVPVYSKHKDTNIWFVIYRNVESKNTKI